MDLRFCCSHTCPFRHISCQVRASGSIGIHEESDVIRQRSTASRCINNEAVASTSFQSDPFVSTADHASYFMSHCCHSSTVSRILRIHRSPKIPQIGRYDGITRARQLGPELLHRPATGHHYCRAYQPPHLSTHVGATASYVLESCQPVVSQVILQLFWANIYGPCGVCT
jgi:hypothetical protein